MTAPTQLAPGDGEHLDVFGTILTLKATTSQTGGTFSLIEAGVDVGGFGPLPHRHLDREESFYVLEGEIDFRVDDGTVHAPAGSFLLVPRGVVHTFSNTGRVPGRLLILHAPAFDGYFRELGALAARGAPDMDALGELMRKWGMEVVPA